MRHLLGLFLLASYCQAQSYTDLLKQAQEQVYNNDFVQAAATFDQAHAQGANDTEKALALAKKSYMRAYQEKNYAAARAEVAKAQNYAEMKPVAQVTLLQVLAECELRERQDPLTAAGHLKKAVQLEGVDWAMPSILLTLGDCHRQLDEADDALKAYARVHGVPGVSPVLQATAHLNTGLTYQYNLRDAERARAAYAKAQDLAPHLREEIAKHLQKL